MTPNDGANKSDKCSHEFLFSRVPHARAAVLLTAVSSVDGGAAAKKGDEPPHATVLRMLILALVMVIAFTERLYSVLMYESIIHEVSHHKKKMIFFFPFV